VSAHLRVPGSPVPCSDSQRRGFRRRTNWIWRRGYRQDRMAVGEACTNIIEHAYLTEPLQLEIELHIQQFPNVSKSPFTILHNQLPVDEAHALSSKITLSRNAAAASASTSFAISSTASNTASLAPGQRVRLVKFRHKACLIFWVAQKLGHLPKNSVWPYP